MSTKNKTKYKKLKRNPKVSMTRYSTHNGFSVINYKGPLITEYLDQMMLTMNRALEESDNVILYRFDLRFPYWFDLGDIEQLPSNYITKFWSSLKSQVRAHVTRLLKEYDEYIDHWFRYFWCKEVKDVGSKPHYHAAVLLPRQFFDLIACRFDEVNLEGILKEAWARAINVPVYEALRAVWIPDNNVYPISADNRSSYAEAFYRVSYLAKTSTKLYGDGSQWFGSSRT